MQPNLQVYDPFQEEVKRKMLAARAAGWNENDIAAFATNDIMQHQMSQQAQASNAPAVPAPPKKKHNFLLDTVAPILGSTAGAAGGFLVGGPVGAIAGGAAGGAGAKALANKIEGNNWKDELGSNAVYGGLGGAGKALQALRGAEGVSALFKGATAENAAMLAKGASNASTAKSGLQLAERAFGKAFTVPAKLAPRLNPVGTANELMTNYPGLVKGGLGDMKNITEAVTGADGALSRLVRKGVGNIRGDIRVDDFMPQIRGALTQSPLITANDEKGILQAIFKMDKPGSLPMTLNPLDAFDNVRSLEKMGYQFIQSSTKLSPNLKNEQIGKVFLTGADALKDSLEHAAGSQNILQGLKNPNTLMELSKIHPNLASKFMNANSFADLRAIQKPFVNLSQMIGLTEDAASSAGANMFGGGATKMVAGGGGALLGGLPGAAVGLMTSPILEGVEQSTRAPLMTNFANLVSKFTNRAATKAAQGGADALKVAEPAVNPTFAKLFKSGIKPQAISHTVLPIVGAVAGGPGQPDASAGPQPFDPFASMGGAGGADMAALPGMGGAGGAGGGATVPMSDGTSLPLSSFSPDVINQMIQDDIATTGGKNIDVISQIVSMQKALTPASTASKSPFGKPTAQQFALANAGMQALQTLEQQIGANPDLVGKSGIPGQHSPLLGGLIRRAAGTGQYDAVANNVIDTLLRLRTGAQANKEEIAMYRTQLFPQAGDSADTVKQKIQSLYQAFTPFLTMGDQSQQGFDPFSQMSGGGSAGFDPFSQMGYAQ